MKIEEFWDAVLSKTVEQNKSFLLNTINHPFGIGDAVHNLFFVEEFYQRLSKRVSSEAEPKIYSLLMLPAEKLALFKLISADRGAGTFNLSNHIIYFDDNKEEFDEDIKARLAKMSSPVILVVTSNIHDQEFGIFLPLKNKDRITKWIGDINPALFSVISRPLNNDYYTEYLSQELAKINPEITQTAVAEYGCYNTTPKSLTHFTIKHKMGLVPGDEIGIKFDSQILALSKDLKEKGINSFYKTHGQSLRLLTPFFNKEQQKNPAQYFAEHDLMFAYIQSIGSFKRLINTAIAASDKEAIDILFNLADDVPKLESLIKSLTLPDELELSVELCSADKEDNELVHRPAKNPQSARHLSLRMKQIKGIDQAEKNSLAVLSTLFGGSGDTSYSEVFSVAAAPKAARMMPFFQSRSWKECFFADFLLCLEQEDSEHYKLLKEYIQLTLTAAIFDEYSLFDAQKYEKRGQTLPPELQEHRSDLSLMGHSASHRSFWPAYTQFIRENSSAISEQFARFAKKTAEQANISNNFDSIIDQSLLSIVLAKDYAEELTQLLVLCPDFHCKGVNFVYEAMNKKNFDALKLMADKNKEQFLLRLYEPLEPREKHNQEQYNALQLAVARNDIAGLELLVALGGNLSEKSSNLAFMLKQDNCSIKIAQIYLDYYEKHGLLDRLFAPDNPSNFVELFGDNNAHLLPLFFEYFAKSKYSHAFDEKFFQPNAEGSTPLMKAIAANLYQERSNSSAFFSTQEFRVEQLMTEPPSKELRPWALLLKQAPTSPNFSLIINSIIQKKDWWAFLLEGEMALKVQDAIKNKEISPQELAVEVLKNIPGYSWPKSQAEEFFERIYPLYEQDTKGDNILHVMINLLFAKDSEHLNDFLTQHPEIDAKLVTQKNAEELTCWQLFLNKWSNECCSGRITKGSNEYFYSAFSSLVQAGLAFMGTENKALMIQNIKEFHEQLKQNASAHPDSKLRAKILLTNGNYVNELVETISHGPDAHSSLGPT